MSTDSYPDSRLRGIYAITDQQLIADNQFENYISSALTGGARILQYRDKSSDTAKRFRQATCCRQLCHQHNALLIINDDIELCQKVEADGVHLGKEDKSLEHARKTLGEQAVIGVSCYNDMARAIELSQDGASYVAFGTMFASPTKPEAPCAGPDIVRQAKSQLDIPVCAIGGITSENADQVVTSGADMIALISTLFAANDIEHTTRELAKYYK